MKKLNKVAMLFASAALATAAGAQTVDNWKNGSGELVWKTAPMSTAGAMPSGRPQRLLQDAMALWLRQLLRPQLHQPLHPQLLHLLPSLLQHPPWPPR